MTDATIFIDGSYFCFYRYYSIMNWWKNAHKDEPLDSPIDNPLFVEKFKKTFIQSVREIGVKFGSNHRIVVGKDCPRANIWRTALYPAYKANRPHDDAFLGGPLFKMAYDELFAAGGVSQVLSHPALEADDCIALSVKNILETTQDTKIYVVTSDKDYLQLACDRVEIYNAAFKKLISNPSDLFCKIVMGDVSDNIKSVLKKCGPKTAMKCYEDRAYFEARLKAENAYDALEFNTMLVDFNRIPADLANAFLRSV